MQKYLKIIIPTLLVIAAILIVYYKLPALFHPHTSITKFADTSDGSLEDYYQLGQSLSVRGTIAATSATFLAVGDIMLSRNVAAAIQKSGDVDLPFSNISNLLKSTDFNFGNLESPVSPPSPSGGGIKGEGGIIGGHSLLFGAPADYLKSLSDYNFQIINLANNHAFDQGLAGIDVTRSTLDNLNIAHEGTGDDLDQAWTPAVVEANGIKIGFIGASYASTNDGGKTTNNYVARIEDLQNLKSAILNLKSQADFIVVTMHAGTEYTRTPNQAQITFAHTAINDGADIVIGAHPHWIQTIEKYCPGNDAAVGEGLKPSPTTGQNCKYIFYSLGNFIFDQNFSQETMQGLTLKITLSKSGSSNPQAPGAASLDDLQGSRIPATLESIELLPIIITNSQPRPATADETKKILQKIGQTSFIIKP